MEVTLDQHGTDQHGHDRGHPKPMDPSAHVASRDAMTSHGRQGPSCFLSRPGAEPLLPGDVDAGVAAGVVEVVTDADVVIDADVVADIDAGAEASVVAEADVVAAADVVAGADVVADREALVAVPIDAFVDADVVAAVVADEAGPPGTVAPPDAGVGDPDDAAGLSPA